MAPPLLLLQNIGLTFGGTPLLDSADLSVSAGERALPCRPQRIGQVHASRKSRPATVEQTSGTRFLQPGATLRYLPQEPDFSGFSTILAYVEADLTAATIRLPLAAPARRSRPDRRRGPFPPVRRRGAARRDRAGARLRAGHPCCSTSRPTISICRPSNGWRTSCAASARRSSSSAMTAASWKPCRGQRRGSTAA